MPWHVPLLMCCTRVRQTVGCSSKVGEVAQASKTTLVCVLLLAWVWLDGAVKVGLVMLPFINISYIDVALL